MAAELSKHKKFREAGSRTKDAKGSADSPIVIDIREDSNRSLTPDPKSVIKAEATEDLYGDLPKPRVSNISLPLPREAEPPRIDPAALPEVRKAERFVGAVDEKIVVKVEVAKRDGSGSGGGGPDDGRRSGEAPAKEQDRFNPPPDSKHSRSPQRTSTLPKLPLPNVSPIDSDFDRTPYSDRPASPPVRKKRITDLPMPPVMDEPDMDLEQELEKENVKKDPESNQPKMRKPK